MKFNLQPGWGDFGFLVGLVRFGFGFFFFSPSPKGRGKYRKYCALQQWTVGWCSPQKTESCLMIKTESRLQSWTWWCVPVNNMKDRKYLTCAAFGEQKIRQPSKALLHLLINLFNSRLFYCLFFCFPWAVGYCLQSSGKIKEPFSQLLSIGYCLGERWTHQRCWVLLYITQLTQR